MPIFVLLRLGENLWLAHAFVTTWDSMTDVICVTQDALSPRTYLVPISGSNPGPCDHKELILCGVFKIGIHEPSVCMYHFRLKTFS